MRRFLLFAVPLFALCNLAAAQTDTIGLFTDAGYTECELNDTGPGMVSVYVVHTATSGSVASQFRVVGDAGVMLSYDGESTQWPLVIGNSQTGVTVAYDGECRFSDILVMTINYFASGSSATCSTLRVMPDPSAPTGTIEVVNCGQSKLEAIGAFLVINSDGTCECGPSTQFTNWGVIKAKYD
ncbi:MAG: hypothetical protein KAT30_02555 [Candidatus Krumholzibacteria bacterium]|nr:hypothetical protein [Candidatus Krumholzibacteria bacterium]